MLETRIKQHSKEDKFQPYLNSTIYYIELANKTMSDIVESELIRRYKPKLNVAKMSEWSGLEFKEPEWKIFIPSKKEKFNHINESGRNIIRNKQRINICKLMSEYYCQFMLDNISKAIEDKTYYKIQIPLNEYDTEHLYCVPPYIKGKGWGMSLGHCCGDDKIVTYVFEKEKIYKDCHGIEVGLKNRLQYMKHMFKEELIRLQ